METTREIYKQKYEAQVREWTAKMDEFRAKADKLTAQAKLDLKPRADAVQSMLDSAKAKVREIAAATDDTWEDVKEDAEKFWNDAKATFEGAMDALKGYQPQR